MTETAPPAAPESGNRRTVLTAALFGAAGIGAAGAAVAALTAADGAGSAASTAAGAPTAATSAAGGLPSSAPTAAANTAGPSASAAGTSTASSATPAGAAPAASVASQTATPAKQPSPGATRITVPKQAADAADRDESFTLAEKPATGPKEYVDFTPVVDTALEVTAPQAPTTSAPTASAASSEASPTAAAPTSTLTAAGAATAGPSGAASSSPAGVTASRVTSSPSGAVTAAGVATASGTVSANGRQGSVLITASAAPRAQSGIAGVAMKAVQQATVFGAAGLLSPEEAKAHLLRRATFGPRKQDRADFDQMGIDAWIDAQLKPMADPTGDAIAAQFNQAGTSIPQVVGSIERYSWDAQVEAGQMVLGRWIFSGRQLFEIVVDVFANLLNCTMPSDSLWSCGPDYQQQVIRKHAYGSYTDMLLAAMRHPAMLTYLNNDESTRAHVNENLGRELLELHTVGVTGGYTEADVVGSARILSGRTLDYQPQLYKYDPRRHYIGAVKVMGFSDPNTVAEQGEAMGDRYLTYLAKLPATAQTVARKLAVRFVSDNPPQALVDRMAQAYLDNNTAIVPVLRTMFGSLEFWASVGQKTRRPAEDLVFSARVLEIPIDDPATVKKGVAGMYWRLWDAGNAPLHWAPPNGYPDVVAAWQSSGQVLQRWSTHRALAGGWYEGMKPTAAMAELAPRANETATAWVDRIGRYVVGGTLPASARAALVEFLGVPASSVIPSWLTWKGVHLAALVLDSLYCQAR